MSKANNPHQPRNPSLIFFTNKLQDPTHHRQMKIPLEFISFGIAEGRMYKHFRNQGSFIAPLDFCKRWGNTVVYGGLFYCPDMEFYSRIFDAYHVCSLSTLGKNHIKDIHHRITADITPIHFDTLNDLARLKYREGEPVSAYMYMGNIEHPKLACRIRHSYLSYRVIDGIEAEHFTSLFKEVKGC